jgi:hypothetical protein
MGWCLMRTERNDMQVCFTSRRRRGQTSIGAARRPDLLYTVRGARTSNVVYLLALNRTDVVTMRNKRRRSVLGPKYSRTYSSA